MSETDHASFGVIESSSKIVHRGRQQGFEVFLSTRERDPERLELMVREVLVVACRKVWEMELEGLGGGR